MKICFVILLLSYVLLSYLKNEIVYNKTSLSKLKNYLPAIVICFFDSLIWKEFYYFYIHSIKANRIINYISYSYDEAGIKLCLKHNINCDLCYANKTVKSLKENTYQSYGFLERMFIRNEVIMNLLMNGVNIILSDIDIIFLKNPVNYITNGNHDISLSVGDVNGVINGGF